MIIDKIENASMYYGVGERIKAALEFLQRSDLADLAVGTYEIMGKDVYVMVQAYDSRTRDVGMWEAHRNYFDVQYVVDGTELMGYAYLDALKVTKEYDADGDYMLLEGNGDFLLATPGTFIILAPQDAHMPGQAVDNKPEPISKVVVKVRV